MIDKILHKEEGGLMQGHPKGSKNVFILNDEKARFQVVERERYKPGDEVLYEVAIEFKK